MLNGTVLTAAACALVAALVGFALGRRSRPAVESPDVPAGPVDQAVAAFSASISEFSEAVTPLWSAHIESSRLQMDEAISALVSKFATIVTLLDAALGASR